MSDAPPARMQLDELLSEDMASAKDRARRTFDGLAAPFGNALVIFGAGQLGRKTAAGLRQVGVQPLAFSDNNSALWGKTIDGLPVYSPADAAEKFGRSAAFVVVIWRGEGTDRMEQRRQPLLDLGCEKVIPFGSLFWKHPELFLPHYSMDLPHRVLEQADDVRRAFDLWEDEASRREFVAQLRWRLFLDLDGLPLPVAHEIYFPPDLVDPSPEEVLVDCGAYTGDTVESFLRLRGDSFRQLFAFEPDPTNFEKLRGYVAGTPAAIREKIVVQPFAVGSRNEKVRFSATGTAGAAVGQGTLELDCITLDTFLTDLEPTWLKMDIEGSEPDALQGARQHIRKTAPVLAVCAYHQQNHLWRIPLLMHEMSEDYHFFLRPHALEGWDVVAYAIPSSRLNPTVKSTLP